MPRFFFCLLPFAAALSGISSAAERLLFADGASDYEIVLARDANAATSLAARELRKWLAQSTGMELPLVNVPSAGRNQVFIGPNADSARAGVTTAGLKPEGFHLKTIGEDIHIVGMDVLRGSLEPRRVSATQTGSLSGVFEFLERCAGIQFLWHDALGTIVPRRNRIVVSDLDVSTSPAWTYRMLAYSPEGQCGQEMFARRLRLGHSHTVTHSHAWHQIMPVEKYGAGHPEWFAEIDGKRKPAYYLERHGGQVCTTNPQVIEVFAQAAIDYFNTHPSRDMFSVSPNDGSGFCTCAECRALDNGTRSDGRPILTDRLITFYNAIAERMVEKHPTKLLGAYAYSYYREPPEKVRAHPNLYLVHATNSAYHQGAGWPEEHEMEKQWRAGARHLAKYDIYFSPDSSLNLIAPVTRHLVEKLRAETEIGIEGGYLYMGQSYEQLGCGHVLLARLMWDAKCDAEALAASYYQTLYGKAGPHVEAYYDLLENQLREVRKTPLDTRVAAIRVALRKRPGPGSHAYTLAAYQPILEEATGHLAKAKTAGLDQSQGERLQRLLDQHELLITTVSGLFAAARLETDAGSGAADAVALLDLIEQREAVRERIKSYAPSLSANLDLGDKAETEALAPHGPLAHLARSLMEARGASGNRRGFPKADFEKVTRDELAEACRWSATGNATIDLETEMPAAGKRSLRVQVPEGSTGAVTFALPVKAETSYRIIVDHWNDPAERPAEAADEADAVTRGEVPVAPRTRVIFRDGKGKAVTRNHWSTIGAYEHVKEWHAFPHLIQTPPETRSISFTIFLHHPGTYLLDNVRIEELGEVNPGKAKRD